MNFPKDFTKDVILPYLALFNEGDKVEFIGGMPREIIMDYLL